MSPTVVQWTLNPWRDRPARAWTAAAFILAGTWIVSGLGLPTLAACALAAGLGASLGSAILPGHYRLDDAGIALGVGPFTQRRPWSEIKRAVRARDGVLLSPFEHRNWLDAYRAMFLPLPSARAPELTADVHALLAGHGL